MPKLHIERATNIVQSARTVQVAGIFDLPPAEQSVLSWDVDIPIEDREWSVGLIVGPSGCGKSTIAADMFGASLVKGFEWDPHRAVVDCFPASMMAKEITLLLSSVGFSSPPAWLRPFHVLSNGEQFRVTMARALAEMPDLAVIDEFTSVVDRQVAQIGSAAVAKTARRRGAKVIAVTCHYDVEDWLDPDWVYLPAEQRFAWRLHRGRPKIELEISRIHHSAWRIFHKHHYLTADLSKAATCFGGYINGELVAFHSYLPFYGKLAYGEAMRGHRSVVLPDFQGVGVGHAMITKCASVIAGTGKRVFRNTGHPAEIAAAKRDANWEMIRAPGRTARETTGSGVRHATDRMTASFEYRGEKMPREEALKFVGGFSDGRG